VRGVEGAFDVDARSRELEQRAPEERLAFALDTWGTSVLFTSSFGVGSGVLLHLWRRLAPGLPVVFIDTGFLFDETLAYRDQLVRLLGLRLEVARPALPTGEFLWQHGADIQARDPDLCCGQNKVAPLKPYLARSSAWVTGLRRDQGRTRERVPILQPTEDGPIKVHPLASMTSVEVRAYLDEHGIPEHPLKKKRYLSIGCWPCTQAVADGEDERAGRWRGSTKTECGLHTFLRTTPT
jgi:phosphoadenosine phosphosulfate reductase